ncbi:MAG: sensor histidine kinase [Bacteriovorax sp.]|nr:sensor histidine kinase [Bacteriovorax sp.]
MRIVENLCNNAVKFGKEHSPVTLFLDMVENMVSIKVHNFGKVITPENLEKLFEPYQRPDEKSTSHKPGWGLGLTLVKGLAEAHHGRVEVESSELDGTSFTVYLSRDCRLKK